MGRRFRALRIVALLCKALAWLALVGGGLVALVIIVVGALAGNLGSQSPLLRDLPLIGRVTGLVSGLAVGVVALIAALLNFVLLYATSEVIDVGLAIEENTRETAFYLRGEGNVPPHAG
jgi:hypothetical protein